MITFDEKDHVYTHDQTQEKYTSVTTLIGKYEHEFDKDKHSARVAKREGVPQELVLEMWQAENDKANERGHKIHKLMENYIELGEEDPSYKWLYASYDKAARINIGAYKSVVCENILHNDVYKIAGMADLIYDHGNTFTIADFKTNKKFNFDSPFNDYLLPPIDHLSNCQFNTYALQMSLYAYMNECLTGKQCKKIVVFYLQDDVWTPINCNYLKSDAIALMKHHLYKSVDLS